VRILDYKLSSYFILFVKRMDCCCRSYFQFLDIVDLRLVSLPKVRFWTHSFLYHELQPRNSPTTVLHKWNHGYCETNCNYYKFRDFFSLFNVHNSQPYGTRSKTAPEDVLSLSYTWSSRKRERQNTLRVVYSNAPMVRCLLGGSKQQRQSKVINVNQSYLRIPL